jgi:predicted ATPase
VQQPELHLHPALQAALGDVLIDAIETDPKSTLIVETHSEHLVLRLLRRIREGANAVTPKGFSTEQVAVYYFDPSLADGTRIVRLRMTPMGDFIDRWPRGFFTDREQELFDA